MQNSSEQPVRGARGAFWLAAGVVAAVTVIMLAASWRRWPDAVVDFGRELHTAWRLAAGASLYRDVDGVYGPLAQSFNGLVFRLWGPGLMTLVTANLVIFAGIAGLALRLFHRAWGASAAGMAGVVLVVLFGFPQLGEAGNYNYATPYAHEVTHGMLALLGMVATAAAWVRAGGAARAAATGLCWGLCWVLKPEFILAGAGVLVGALLLRRARGSAVGPTEIVSGLSCTLAPTLLFAAGLSQSGGFAEGWHHATTAWRVVVTGAAVDPAIQASFSGWDDPWRNLARHGRNTGIALLLLAGTTLLAARLDRVSRVWPRVAGAVLPAALLLVFLRQPGVADEAGAALLGLLAGRLLAFRWPVPAREASPEGRLLTVAAAGMMARMMLNGRLDHFGFYQAALAVMVLVAVLWAEWPALLPRERRWGRGALQAAAAAIVLGLVGVGWNTSRAEWAQRTYAVGEGPDRFLVRPPPRAHGVWLNYALAVLEQEKATGSLLVLPEGLMLNYLARMPSPVAPFFLFSFATRGEAEARLVAQLERRPPQWVVVLARDLREYGIERYGERPGEGALLVAWVDRHYELVAAAAGRHPLKDPAGDVWVMRRKPGPG